MSAQEQKLRLFVALAVPEEVKTRLAAMQSELRTQLAPLLASWTRPESMHLTLHFLGDVESSRVDTLAKNLAAALMGFGSLSLVARQVGCFPDARSPRVFWVAVQDRAGRLRELQRRIVTVSAGFGRESAEKAFVGHVTLTRAKQLNRRQIAILADVVKRAENLCFGEWKADQIHLMRSELSPSGSRYSSLAGLPL